MKRGIAERKKLSRGGSYLARKVLQSADPNESQFVIAVFVDGLLLGKICRPYLCFPFPL